MATIVFGILAGISFVLTAWRWVAAARFPLHWRRPVPSRLPSLALLKPLKGCDAETKNCLRSWLGQEYHAPMQALFGVASENDPVCALVRELLAEFPNAGGQLIICGQSLGANAKVSTLRQLEPHLRHDLVLISDADVVVPPDFAAQAAATLAATGAGLVNCFYRLGNPVTLAMEWEAVAINADFWPQVLQARSLKPVDFALGAAMALPRSVLQAAGGFAVLADYLADDNQLGRRVAGLGKTIEFTGVVAECRDSPMGWAQVWAHQSRWARTIRVCQPAPFFFSILNNSTLWPLLFCLMAGPRAAAAFAVCLLFRVGTALHQRSRLMGGPAGWPWFWMAPVKDMLDVLVWAGAFLGNRVSWRGETYLVRREGKLVKLSTN